VHPTRPETGYGYIEISELNKPLSDFKGIPVYNVKRFLEKPNLEDAEHYQASRFFYWNSGMFFWRLSTFINSLQKSTPALTDAIEEMTTCINNSPENEDPIQEVFETIPDISIDYALMEKADNVYVALGDFRWDDVGSWDSLSRFRPRDEARNTSIGNPVLIDCKNVTVYNQPGDQMAVGVVGMNDIVVVTTDDGVVVCPKDRCQDVKKVVQVLKERNAKQL
jgi:mannose-1-phosphate guanylyltransferase